MSAVSRRDLVGPEIGEVRRWPRAPRTLGECRSNDTAKLWIGCTCGGHWEETDAHCRAFDTWTIEELQRLGYWRCQCGAVPAVAVYELAFMHCAVERWALSGHSLGWMRA